MISSFTYEQCSLLIRILMAHFIVDFFLQSGKAAREKNIHGLKSWYLWEHVLLVFLLTTIFIWNLNNWLQIIFIGVAHLLIDLGKIKASLIYRNNNKKNYGLWLFVCDQSLHLLAIGIAWLWIIKGWGNIQALIMSVLLNHTLLICVLGYIIVIGPISYLIRFLTEKWADDIIRTDDGLENAGMWIGILERIIILTLILLNQFTAIGFLITAKSILRLIDRPERVKIDQPDKNYFSPRKHTEYVLIGTFLSFTGAITTGVLIRIALH
ncbi:MAG: hypothetical protein NVS1B13_18730 [Flavisolibacter sp.]